MIPVNEPVISKEAKANVLAALDSGWLSSAGPFVKQFEKEFAEYLGVKHAITATSGTAALHLALLSLGIGKDDEVIVPAFTMAASWMAVLYVDAKPVFVDCELETFNIDPQKIELKITPKTKAIMPVHIYGHACDMDAVLTIAKKHNLMVIEDAAEVLGGKYKNQLCGSFGEINCFSFYANKILATGEGGMVVTNRDDVAEKVRKYKDLYHSDKKRFIHEGIGFNYRMSNLQAAVGLGELKHLNEYLQKKRWMAEQYSEGLKNIPGIKTPRTKPEVENTYWMYGILIDKERFGMSRDELKARLKACGIDTRDFFYPPQDQPVLKAILGKEEFPCAKYLSENGLYLPSGLALTEKQIQTVISSIKNLSKYD